MANLTDILSQLNKRPANPGYGEEVAQTNAFQQAPLLAQAITRYQKEQRAQPYAADLQGLSSQFAKTPVAQQPQVNARANALRQAYIRSGGSPIDLPKELWGSDPIQGFQTGAGQFTPGYAGDNLSIGQKQKQSSFTGMYEGKPTWERQYQQGSLDVQKQNSEKSQNTADWNKTWDILKYNMDQQKDTSKQFQNAKEGAYKYFDSIKVGQPSSDPTKLGQLEQVDLSPQIKSQLKSDFNVVLGDAMKETDPLQSIREFREDILKKYGQFKGSHLLNALESALGSSSGK